jgi:hypothetical protein
MGMSGREAYAADKVLEPRVGAQRVEGGPQEDRRVKALLVGFFQPGHCLILFVQTYIHQSNLGSILFGSILQITQYLYGFLSPA